MSDIAVMATPIAATNSTAAAAAGSASKANADTPASAPFATVLKEHVDNPTAAKPTSADSATAIAAVADAGTQSANFAALLPMLLGSAAMAETAATGSTSKMTKKVGADDVQSATDQTSLILALPNTSGAVQPPSLTPTNAAPVNSAPAQAETAAAMTANLAAAPDVAAKAEATAGQSAKTDGSFEALLTDQTRAAITQAASAHIPAATSTAMSGHIITTPVGSKGWDTQVGNQLVWMAGNNSSRAELVLTPPQMGRIEILLTMSGDQATASFVSASPAVREAIETAMPRLREVLADAGVTLGQTQVGAETPKQWNGDADGRNDSFRGASVGVASAGSQVTARGAVTWASNGRGLVDTFA